MARSGDAWHWNITLAALFTGNVRLEDGRPTDLWYNSCVDLVHSRFNPNDYDLGLGVTGKFV